MKRRKYQLPYFAKLEHISIDLEKLRAAADLLEGKYVNVMEANPTLCDNHSMLVEKVYENFNQINLTEISGVPMNFTSNIKERIRRKEESLYNKPTKDYEGTYFQEIINQFRAPAMRVRVTKLAGKSEIPFHIDYDPTYATRVVIPIYSNRNVINQFVVKNEIKECYLEPGIAYFLNTGFSHAVFNKGTDERVAMMFSLDGQEDLSTI